MSLILIFSILWFIAFFGGLNVSLWALGLFGVSLGDGEMVLALLLLIASFVAAFRITRWLRLRAMAPPEPWPELPPSFPGDEERDERIAARIKRITALCTLLGAALGVVLAIALAIVGPPKGRPMNIQPWIMAPVGMGGAGMFLGLSITCLFAPESFLTGEVGRPHLEKIGTRNVIVARLACLLVAILIGMPLVGLSVLAFRAAME